MRIENRADREVIEAWITTFSPQELAKNGWTTEELLKLSISYTGLYLFYEASLAASLIYQQVDKNHYEVLFLGTDPGYRRKGCQERLLQQFSKLHPGAKLWLECRADNNPALELYKKSGFVITGNRPHYYKDGMAAVLMEFIA